MALALVGIGISAGLLGQIGMERRHEAQHQSTRISAEHGGIVSVVGHRKYEFVVKPDMVALYVSDDQKAVASDGGSLILHYGAPSEQKTIKLEPAGDNKFEASRPFTLTNDTAVSATVTLGGSAQQVVFNSP